MTKEQELIYAAILLGGLELWHPYSRNNKPALDKSYWVIGGYDVDNLVEDLKYTRRNKILDVKAFGQAVHTSPDVFDCPQQKYVPKWKDR